MATGLASALNNQNVLQKNPDTIQAEDQWVVDAETQQNENLARIKVMKAVTCITNLEDAINCLKTRIDDYKALVVSTMLETEHEQLQEAGVSTSVNTNFSVAHLYKYSTYVTIHVCVHT